MNAILLATALAIGQSDPDVAPPASTALDGVWTVVAMEVNGRPNDLPATDRGLAIKNNTLTLPGVAALHGTVRLDLGPKGTLRAVPAAAGTGNRRDPIDAPATAGTVGTAGGVYVRTADYLVLTIGDPSSATATGTGIGAKVPDTRPDVTPPVVPGSPAAERTVTTVGQPPVSLVLRRATGSDAPPSTAAVPPPPAPGTEVVAPSLRRMSSVVGSNVTLSDGSTAGRVEDLVYGANGALDYAVLNNNGSFAAVPWNAMTWNAATGAAMLPLTTAQFATIPTFRANDWSNMLTNPAFAQRVQNTFINFRDTNGRPVFNLGANATNQLGTQNQTGTQTTTQKITPPAGQPGTQPGAQPKAPPPTAQPKSPPPAQPKGPPPAPPKSPPPKKEPPPPAG